MGRTMTSRSACERRERLEGMAFFLQTPGMNTPFTPGTRVWRPSWPIPGGNWIPTRASEQLLGRPGGWTHCRWKRSAI